MIKINMKFVLFLFFVCFLAYIIYNLHTRKSDRTNGPEYFSNNSYTLGILVPIYNRSEISTRVLDRLSQSKFPPNTIVLLLDDGSTEEAILDKIKTVQFPDHVRVEKLYQSHNEKGAYHNIGKNIKKGFDFLIDNGCDYIMNLDDDMLVKKDFILKLMDLAFKIDIESKGGFITGFLETKNVNNGVAAFKEKHRELYEKYQSPDYIMRSSGGGCNHLMTKASYTNIYRPGLEDAIKNNKKWDNVVGNYIGDYRKNNDSHGIWYSPNKGVMQHMGFNGLNKFVWDFDYEADGEDKQIFRELGIDKMQKF